MLPGLAAWMEENTAVLFLSAVTVAEIEDGIAKLRRKAADLTAWLDALLHLYADRVLPFDGVTARLAGRLSDQARGQGRAPGFADIIIAATAMRHDLILLTRNLRHFQGFGLRLYNPFTALPPG